MYNIRYHIASLVAVFLALAIGLVLGGLVVQQGGFDQQQSALVASLQSEFSKLKKENTSLRSTLSLERSYGAQMTDSWAAGRLSGQTVLVLTSSGTADAADAAVAAIKSAGGTPAVVTILKPSLGMAPSAEATASESAPTTAPAEQTVAQAAAQLAAEWNGTNSDRTETSSLVHSGAIKISGLGDSTVAAQIIDVAAAGKSPDAAGLDIAQAYANAGMIAVGAQAYGADTGVAAAAAARKLSAFDTLGTNPGRFTLVALFSGGQQGYYSSNGHTALAFPPVPKP